MTKRNFFRSLTACIVASALDLGYLADVVRRKWRFTTEVRLVDTYLDDGVTKVKYWYAFLQQLPLDAEVVEQTPHSTILKYHSAHQLTLRGRIRREVQEAAKLAILERQYELEEPVDSASSRFYAS